MGVRIGDISPLLEDTHLAYYYHGLIYADGCLFRDKTATDINGVRIALAKKDMNYVEKFASLLGANVHIINREGNRQTQYVVVVKDIEKIPQLCCILGCGLNKTKNPPPPTLFRDMDVRQRLSVCCGHIDGDGCIRRNIIMITASGEWLEVISAMYDGLISSCKLDKCGYTRCYLTSVATRILYSHALDYNLPVFDRKWKNGIDLTKSQKVRKNKTTIKLVGV